MVAHDVPQRIKGEKMNGIEMHYIIGGLTVLAGFVAGIKVLDYLAQQTARRLLNMAGRRPIN